MKIVVMTLANDEVCVCGRCTRPGGDGSGRSYKPMIDAIRDTWAAQEVEGVKCFYIYGHRDGIEFPEDSTWRDVDERSCFPDDDEKAVMRKRAPFAIGDCIYSDTPEGRENIYYKTMDGFEWLLENEEFDYLIRSNAGSYIDLSMFKSYLEGFDIRDKFYAGSTGVYDNRHNQLLDPSQPAALKFASGSCFIVSRDMIQSIIDNRAAIDLVRSPYEPGRCVGDDVTFAKYFTHDLDVGIVEFSKYAMTSPSQATSVVKNYMQCYYCHTIDPELHHAVHRAKQVPGAL
jgi:hypothetical protein